MFCHCDNVSEKTPNFTEAPFILSHHFIDSGACLSGPVAFSQACDKVWTSWRKGMAEKSILLHINQKGKGEGREGRRGKEEGERERE